MIVARYCPWQLFGCHSVAGELWTAPQLVPNKGSWRKELGMLESLMAHDIIVSRANDLALGAEWKANDARAFSNPT